MAFNLTNSHLLITNARTRGGVTLASTLCMGDANEGAAGACGTLPAPPPAGYPRRLRCWGVSWAAEGGPRLPPVGQSGLERRAYRPNSVARAVASGATSPEGRGTSRSSNALL